MWTHFCLSTPHRGWEAGGQTGKQTVTPKNEKYLGGGGWHPCQLVDKVCLTMTACPGSLSFGHRVNPLTARTNQWSNGVLGNFVSIVFTLNVQKRHCDKVVKDTNRHKFPISQNRIDGERHFPGGGGLPPNIIHPVYYWSENRSSHGGGLFFAGQWMAPLGNPRGPPDLPALRRPQPPAARSPARVGPGTGGGQGHARGGATGVSRGGMGGRGFERLRNHFGGSVAGSKFPST